MSFEIVHCNGEYQLYGNYTVSRFLWFRGRLRTFEDFWQAWYSGVDICLVLE